MPRPSGSGPSLRGLTVRHIDELAEVVRSEGISIGIIATPAAAAQEVSDALAAAGVTAILNFAPTVLSVPDSVDVRKVDLAAELQILSFHEKRKARGLARWATRDRSSKRRSRGCPGRPAGGRHDRPDRGAVLPVGAGVGAGAAEHPGRPMCPSCSTSCWCRSRSARP